MKEKLFAHAKALRAGINHEEHEGHIQTGYTG